MIDVEPIHVWRRRPVLDDVMERPEPTAAVVEHAIEDDAHAARVTRVEELAQRIVAAEERVDLEVVVRVVAVVGSRRKDRREVERGNA